MLSPLVCRQASFSGLVIFLLLVPPLFHSATYTAETAALYNSSVLHLDVNFSISFSSFFEYWTNGTIAKVHHEGQQPEFVYGILSGTALPDAFLPIFSSPGFIRNYSGFSFGFYIKNVSSPDAPSFSMYLAVCGAASSSSVSTGFQYDISTNSSVQILLEGYVTPLWIANAERPLPALTSSLVVVRMADSNHGANALQFRDQSGNVVWNVADVGTMELKDTGNLVIYDSINRSKVAWQSLAQPRYSSVIQNQKLTVGIKLISNDLAYTARMEEGGLVVYLNKPQFSDHPAAFWVVPSFPVSTSQPFTKADLKKQILNSRCAQPLQPSYAVLKSDMFVLKEAQCSSTEPADNVSSNYIYFDIFTSNWSFLKLENDGRLYVYDVDLTSTNFIPEEGLLGVPADQTKTFPYVDWGDCAAPMACGPLGICTPFASTLCACPGVSPEGTIPFILIDATDNTEGCTLIAPLPSCTRGDEHIHTTEYLQLENTSSIFLFGGWPIDSFIPPSKDVEDCKRNCSSNCSCTGFFYQVNQRACFFMADGISLLHTVDLSNSIISDISSGNGTVLASNFVTYLKYTSKHKAKPLGFIIASSVLAFLLMFGLVLYVLHARKEKRKTQAWRKAKQEDEEELREILPLLPTRFSYDDLEKATQGFSNLLGAGGFGSVYAGVLSDGHRVAVKMLEASILKGQQSKQFLAELATVGCSNHHNIVRLVGFCWEVYHPRLLVYEYMERGSLDQWLFATVAEGVQPTPLALNWQTRHNIALGIARGLTYLHEDCPQPILHFDIKPQNILLDNAFVAKLADFGLSRLMQRGTSKVVTGVRGTPGYIAPEWLAHGAVSKKSDIYSMGMVMLEIVGGRKNIDISLLDSASEEWHFPKWAAKECEQGRMLELVDKRIAHAYDKEQASRLIQTAFWCINEDASKRPSAPMVVQWLEGNGFIEVPPFSSIVRFSQFQLRLSQSQLDFPSLI